MASGATHNPSIEGSSPSRPTEKPLQGTSLAAVCPLRGPPGASALDCRQRSAGLAARSGWECGAGNPMSSRQCQDFTDCSVSIVCRLVKSTMEKLVANADYLRRARRFRQEPSSCARAGWSDARGSCRTQWGPRHRGQPDGGEQARSACLDAGTTRRGRGSHSKRPSALATGAGPLPVRTAGDRPSGGCLVLLQNLKQRHDLLDRLDCHRKHLPPARQLRPCAGAGGRE
jgi:hypothetical protein